MSNGFTMKDSIQAAVGAFSAVLFFFALRSGQTGPWINPWAGLIISAVWGIILFIPIQNMWFKKHFPYIAGISLIMTTLMSLIFGLATSQELFSFKFFGSPAMIATWMAIPIAMLFDKRNIISVYKRHYMGGK